MKYLIHLLTILLIISCVSSLYSQQWQPFNNGLIGPKITGIITTNEKIFVCTDNRGIFSSNLNEADWKNINNDMDTNCAKYPGIQFISVNNNNLYFGTYKGLVVSSNNGNNWNFIKDGYMDSIYTEMSQLLSVGNKLIYSIDGAVFISNNYGVNWQLAASGYLYLFISSIVSADVNHYYAGTISGFYNGRLLTTTDGGNKWDSLYMFDDGITALAVEGNTIIAGTSHNGLYLSNDEGKSWTKINNGITSTINTSSIIFTSKGIFASIGGTVYMTQKNSDYNWKPVNIGISDVQITCLALNDNILYAGTSGKGVFKLDLSILDVDNLIVKQDITLKPNPAQDFVNINFPENFQSYFAIYIYDALGNIIYEKECLNTSSIQIDTKKYPSGIYYLQVNDKNETFSKKFLVVH